MMDKKEWKAKEKEFLEMLDNSEKNRLAVIKQIEELEVFLTAVRAQIETFK